MRPTTPRSNWTRAGAPPRLGAAVLVLAAMAAMAGCWPDEPEGLGDAIDRVVLDAMEEGPISGVSVAVFRGFRVIHRKGYGLADIENEIPVSPETIFKVGSITKQFTAALVLQLADEGLLGLEDRLTDHIPDYPGYGSEVTISDLLSHTSGIRNYTTMEPWWETLTVEMEPRRLIAIFEEEPFDFRPGTRFSYSNSGYALLGWIVEEVTGQPYGGVLNEKLFVPLQLESTSYCDDRALVPNRARGYQVIDGAFAHAAHVSMSQTFAAGGICSNVLDLVRWSRLLARGRVVGADGYQLMRTPKTLRDGTRIEYGYGMAIGYLEGYHRASHVGGMLGFSGHLAHYDEDDVTIAVLTNTEGANASGIESAIARIMLGLGDREVRDILLAPEELAQYTGTYDLSLTRVTMEADAGRLRTEVSVPGIEGRHTLLYQGDHRFVAERDSEIEVRFLVEEGTADELVLAHKGITMRGSRMERVGR